MKVVQQHHILHQSSEINCHCFLCVLYDSIQGFESHDGELITEFHFWLNYSFHSPLPTNLTKRQHFKPRDAPTFSKPGITDEQTFSLFACERLLITAISSSLSSQTPLILQIQGPFSMVKYDPINLIANTTVDEEPSHSDGIIRELRNSVV